MVDLDFAIEGVRADPDAASPLLRLALRLKNQTPALPILNIMLNCQIRIEPAQRSYAKPEHESLKELYGEPSQWGHTLRSLLWTHTNVSVPAFGQECTVDLPVPCSYDFNIAATKYFHGLKDGEVPLTLLYSGPVFYRDTDGQMQIAQIPWTKESTFRLPVSVWQAMMDHYYPESAWLCLRRDTFEQLYRYKRQKGLLTFERAIEDLIETSMASPSP